MLSNLWKKIKWPFIRAWNWFISETFEGTIDVQDHPKGGSRVYQMQKLFGVKFKITLVKHINLPPNETVEALVDIFTQGFKELGKDYSVIKVEDSAPQSEPEIREFTDTAIQKPKPKKKSPTKKTTPKKKTSTKKKSRK